MLCSCFWIQPWGFGIPVGRSILGSGVARDFSAMVAGPRMGVGVAGRCGQRAGWWNLEEGILRPPTLQIFHGFPKTGGLRFLP